MQLFYKIITKILANRLKRILPCIISENQGGFIPKRQMTDNVIIVREAIHNSIQRKEKGMVIKLDMANAFDRVNHKFLVVVLQKFGISSKFIDIVMACITTPWIAPLINGRPHSYFQSIRGLRQGCLLSPFLYIIMAETLSIQLENQRETRKITSIRIGRGVKGMNHSLFAYDTLLIGGSSRIIAKRFKFFLDDFLYVSGGLLNNNKCRIYSWNVPVNTMQRISQIMEIPIQLKWSHFTYLGLLLAKEVVKAEVWNKQIEKMRGKIQSWGMTWLNLVGRSILIKAFS